MERKRLQELITYLVKARTDLALFTREQAAHEAGVSYMTVYNFETNRYISSELLVYYLTKVATAIQAGWWASRPDVDLHSSTAIELGVNYNAIELADKLNAVYCTNVDFSNYIV